MRIDFTGHRYGFWTVLHQHPDKQKKAWVCRCVCGTEKPVRVSHFRSGKSQSCGCLKIEKLARRNDITGQRFGKLLADHPVKSNRFKQWIWFCYCDCGNSCHAIASKLLSGLKQSCGCLSHPSGSDSPRFIHGQSNNRKYLNAMSAKWRAARLERTPAWSDLDRIQEIYNGCPKGYHVDHILPLQGKLISGLHVPENLQYLSKADNMRKQNHYTPQILSSSSITST